MKCPAMSRIRASAASIMIVTAVSLGLLQLNAQSTTADILGTVADSMGAVLPSATIVVENLGTHQKSQTTAGANGEYVFNLLQPGSYSITINAPGFKTFNVPNVTLSAGDRERVNTSMVLGSADETIQVTAQAPALQTDSSELASTISSKATEDLPLNGRNFINLAQIAPGANEGNPSGLTSGGRPDDRRQTSSVSVNGQSDVINEQLVDGLDNNERIIGTIGVRPSIDGIQEIRVQTNVYTAEVGRTAGGIINVLTRSGSDDLHGTVYEFLRNDKLDAYPFAFGQTIPKPELRQNQFGGSLGGPIRKNRTFFFADYEGFRLVQLSNPTLLTVPTLYEEEHPGDFSDVGGQVLTNSQIDPVGLQYFKLYPTPTSSGAADNFTALPRKTQNTNTIDARVDHRFSDSNLFYARYTYNKVDTVDGSFLPTVNEDSLNIDPGGNIFDFLGPAHNDAHNGQLNYIHIFSPQLLMELKAGYTRISNQAFPLNYGENVSSAFGAPNVNINPATSGLAPVDMVLAASLGDGAFLPIGDIDNTFQYQGTVTLTRGAHNIKAGAALIRRQALEQQNDYGTGFYVVLDLPSLLQGSFLSSERSIQIAVPHYRTWEPSVYVQDDWHATHKLTLNLGIRYDVFTPFTEAHNQISDFDSRTGLLDVAGQNGVSDTADVETDYRNVAPRFGFAYDIGHGMVLRGGFGFSFFPDNYTSGASLNNQPFVANWGPCGTGSCQAGFNALANGLPLPTPSSATNPTGSIASSTAYNFRSAYLEQFNLTVQKDFKGTVATVSYVGMLGRHLVQGIPDLNAPPPNTAANPNLLRPYYSVQPGLTSVSQLISEGTSSYNALQAMLERRYNHGLTFNVNYTWAHGLDNAVGISNILQEGAYAIPSNTHLDYGNSDVDVRNRFAFTANYEIPFGHALAGIPGALAKGWQVNTLYAYSTGIPLTVLNGSYVSNANPGSHYGDRPNVTGNPRLSHPKLSEWFNTSAFLPQTPGTLGDSARNSVYGPQYRHLDLSLFKVIPLHDKLSFEFRAECFNVTNTSNFAAPDNTYNAPGQGAFGEVGSTSPIYNPRLVQFAFRLRF